MANNSGLKRYQALKKRAERKGIAVPRGTNMVELEALLEGKVARCVTTPAKKAPAKKAPAKKAPAKKAPAKKAPAKKAPAPSRTPTATTTTTRRRRRNTSSSGQGSLFGFD